MRPTPWAIALVLLLLASATPAATAQEDENVPPPEPANVPGRRLVEDEVWDEDVSIADENVTVSGNATLTIRGARVTLSNVSLTVRNNATLRIESLPGDPAAITSGAQGWGLAVFGRVVVEGLPGDEVVLEGIRGSSGFTGGTALFLGGFSVGYGSAEVSHAKLRNYSAGMIFANGAKGRLDHLTFEEGRGIAIAMTEVSLPLTNSTFRGEGAQVFGSVPKTPFQFSNLTFENTTTALTVRGAYSELRDIRGRNVTVCITYVGFSQAKLWNLDCEDFRSAAITTQSTATSRQPSARITAEGVRARSTDKVDGALVVTLARSLELRNSTLGPLDGPGLYVEGIVPTLENVSFQGVTHYNAVYANVPDNATFAKPGTGEPGGAGWLRVVQKSPFRIVDPDGQPAPGMRFDVIAEDTGVAAFSNKSLHDAFVAPALEKFSIDKAGKERRLTFRVLAGNGTYGAKIEGYVPSANETRLVVLEGESPEFGRKRDAPAFEALPALVALAALAVALRRRAA